MADTVEHTQAVRLNPLGLIGLGNLSALAPDVDPEPVTETMCKPCLSDHTTKPLCDEVELATDGHSGPPCVCDCVPTLRSGLRLKGAYRLCILHGDHPLAVCTSPRCNVRTGVKSAQRGRHYFCNRVTVDPHKG